MLVQVISAKSVSYGGKRDLNNVKAIVIHYTGNNGDTAVGNGNYFKNTNTRQAGAHYFIDQSGKIVQSISPMYIAWSVGGDKYADCSKTGGGKYYQKYTNANTVSIELCDIASKSPSKKMIKATKNLIAKIRTMCPNATKVIRHFDVNGKHCPASMMDSSNWNKFLENIAEKEAPKKQSVLNTVFKPKSKFKSYKVRILVHELNIRKLPNPRSRIVGKVYADEIYTIKAEDDGWGKLKSGIGWINVSSEYVKKL